jgi:hypothetical protein
MTMHVAHEALVAAVHHLDRPLCSESQQRTMDLHRDVLAGSERSPQTREHEMEFVGL